MELGESPKCAKFLIKILFAQFVINQKLKSNTTRWPPKVAKIEIFPLRTGYSCTTLQVKKLLKITRSLTVSEIFSMFYFPLKSKMVAKSDKIEIFPLGTGYSCNTPVILCGSEIRSKTPYLLPFLRYFQCFIFAKIQHGHQKWRKLKFFPLVQDTLVLPCGSKSRSKSLYLLRFSRYSHFFIFR